MPTDSHSPTNPPPPPWRGAERGREKERAERELFGGGGGGGGGAVRRDGEQGSQDVEDSRRDGRVRKCKWGSDLVVSKCPYGREWDPPCHSSVLADDGLDTGQRCFRVQGRREEQLFELTKLCSKKQLILVSPPGVDVCLSWVVQEDSMSHLGIPGTRLTMSYRRSVCL
jgi:hypothetical protein